VFTDLAAATCQANQWHAEGRLRALLGVGGDGTAAELINRIDEGVPLGLVPAGNSNLLARYFGLQKDPELLCRTIADGLVARVDAGRANGRLFSLMASCGFDAAVVDLVHENRTSHISFRNYVKALWDAVRSYRFPEIRLQWDGEWDTEGDSPMFADHRQPTLRVGARTVPAKTGTVPSQLSARWAFVFNLPCYGGGFRIAPQAEGSDGLLDLCTLRRGYFWPGLAYAAAVVAWQHRRLGLSTAHRVRRLRITSDASVPYQLDGDPGGVLPLSIEVLPGRLTLVVPKEAVATRQTGEG
jgi:diacylglycerol kinase (ATP)